MARRAKQLQFEGFLKPKDVFGGSLLKGNPKTKRPLDSKLPVLLTLRGVQSAMRSPKTFERVNRAVRRSAKKYGVRIYEFANVGNHLHILIRVTKLTLWSAFIRELTGRIASIVKEFFKVAGNYWKYRPHTRIVRGWKSAYNQAKMYVYLNILEAEGHIDRKETKTLKDYRAIFSGG